MKMITSKEVISAIESYYEGGSLEYDGGWTKAKSAFSRKKDVSAGEVVTVKELQKTS